VTLPPLLFVFSLVWLALREQVLDAGQVPVGIKDVSVDLVVTWVEIRVPSDHSHEKLMRVIISYDDDVKSVVGIPLLAKEARE
jgi:hypothetical protein